MRSIDELSNDMEDVSNSILGDLNADERIRLFAKAAAEGETDRIEQLYETAPTNTYRMPDDEFQSGVQMVRWLSALAAHQLTRLRTAVLMHEAGRDKHAALILLNEALERLSQGHFSVDGAGNAEIPDSWPNEYGEGYSSSSGKLGTKYRELWDRNNMELAIPEPDRSRAYFTELAAASMLGYRGDLDAFDEFDADYVHSEVHRLETRLMATVVEFSKCYHTWRLVAEEYLGISLDELLAITTDEPAPFDQMTGPTVPSEEECENLLSTMELYIEGYRDSMAALAEHLGEEVPDELLGFDPEEVAEAAAEEMIQAFDEML